MAFRYDVRWIAGAYMTPKRKLLTIALIITALGFLYPGITQPVLSLSGTVENSRIAELGIDMIAGDNADDRTRQFLSTMSAFLGFDRIEGQMEVYSKSRSIWGTVEALASTGNLLVAVLIVTFSIVIPSFKLLLQCASLFITRVDFRRPVLWLNGSLSKWSMADVFVMALLVAFLAGSASDQTGDTLTMHARLEPGFYYFLAYCLFSIVAGVILRLPEATAVRQVSADG
jgi:hypothetical protein